MNTDESEKCKPTSKYPLGSTISHSSKLPKTRSTWLSPTKWSTIEGMLYFSQNSFRELEIFILLLLFNMVREGKYSKTKATINKVENRSNTLLCLRWNHRVTDWSQNMCSNGSYSIWFVHQGHSYHPTWPKSMLRP